MFFEKGRTFVFYNPWFVVPYTRVYCTCSGILPVVCCTISTDSAQVKIYLIQFLQYCMITCKGNTGRILSALKNHRITILLRLVTDLQTHKQTFSIFVHKNRDFEASNSLIWRLYEARLSENKKNLTYFFRRWFEKITCG